jgi:hypothetical protein
VKTASGIKTKLKNIKNGDEVEIRGEVFHVSAVERQDETRNIRLELQGHDGGSVTLIGGHKARVKLAARAS